MYLLKFLERKKKLIANKRENEKNSFLSNNKNNPYFIFSS